MKPYYEDDLVTLYHGDALELHDWASEAAGDLAIARAVLAVPTSQDSGAS